MTRKSTTKAEAEAPEAEATIAEVETKPIRREVKKPKLVKLRLIQNDFINGKFAKKGSVLEVSEEEAKLRLSKEQKWETIT